MAFRKTAVPGTGPQAGKRFSALFLAEPACRLPPRAAAEAPGDVQRAPGGAPGAGGGRALGLSWLVRAGRGGEARGM